MSNEEGEISNDCADEFLHLVALLIVQIILNDEHECDRVHKN